MEPESNGTTYNYKELFMGSDSWKIFDVAWLLVTSLITFGIIMGNFITVIVLTRNRRLRCRKNALVGSLAVSDLCVGINHVIYMTLYCLSNPTKKWNIGFILFITNLSISLLHMVFIGLERFIAVVKPLHFRSLVSNKVTIVIVFICWAIPIATLFPVYVMNMKDPHVDNGLYIGDRIHFIITIVSYIFILMTFNVFYNVIYFIAKAETKKIQQFRLDFPIQESVSATTSETQEQNPTSAMNNVKQHHRTVLKGYRMAMVIKVSYLFLSLPITIHASLIMYGLTPTFTTAVFEVIGQDLVLFNSAVNILLYAFINTEFRAAFMNIFCNKCNRNSVTDTGSIRPATCI